MNYRKEAPFMPEDAYVLFKDGDQWCCVGWDFINPTLSPCGFSRRPGKAIRRYQEEVLASMEVNLESEESLPIRHVPSPKSQSIADVFLSLYRSVHNQPEATMEDVRKRYAGTLVFPEEGSDDWKDLPTHWGSHL